MQVPSIPDLPQVVAKLAGDVKRLQLASTNVTPQLPVCRVVLTQDKALGPAYSFASTSWFVVSGMDSMLTLGSDGVPSYLTIPDGSAGLYVVSYRCSVVANVAAVAGICLNEPNPSTAVLTRDDGAAVNAGAGTLNLNAWDEVQLAAGDRLYWMNWAASAATLQSSGNGMFSRMYVRYIKQI